MSVYAIIPAAGKSSRYGKNKLFEKINDKPVIAHVLEKISNTKEINGIVICTSVDIYEEIQEVVEKQKSDKVISIILGGKSRQESVFCGLYELLDYNPEYVLIHDGARPLIKQSTIEKSIRHASLKGSSVVAVRTKDTIKEVDENKKVKNTLNRDNLWNIQTPQTFRFKDLFNAHEKFEGYNLTDDSALLEKFGKDIYITEGCYENIKITTKEDLIIAKAFINAKS